MNAADNSARVARAVFRRLESSFGRFPGTYLAVDVETTGLSPSEDLILQFGWCRVVDGKVDDCRALTLNWVDKAGISRPWLEKRMDAVRRGMAQNGRTYRFDVDTLQRDGKEPIPALLLVYETLRRTMDSDGFILAHNGFNFDFPLIESALAEFLQVDLKFGEDRCVDTGIIEKAIQLGETPYADESLAAFSHRVGNIRAKGIKWSLDGHCRDKYNLDAKMRHNHAYHDAGHDAYAVHLLLETFREAAAAATEQMAEPEPELAPEVDPFAV